MATGRKTATLGVVGLRTDGDGTLLHCIALNLNLLTQETETSNELGDDVHFSNISVFSRIDQYALSSMPLMSWS